MAILSRITAVALLLGAVSCSRGPGAYAPAERPPATRVATVTETIHGVTVTDDYRWLEGASNADGSNPGQVTPEIAAWTDAERRYTRAVLDNVPGRDDVEARLAALLDIGEVSVPLVVANRYFFWNRDPGASLPIVYTREGALGTDRELVRAADLDPAGLTGVRWIQPSPDGRLLAYGTYRAGDVDGALRVMDVETGRPTPLEIRGSPHAVQWLPDSSGFIYQRLGNPADRATNRVLFHHLGSDPSGDVLLHRQVSPVGSSGAGSFEPFATLSRDGRWLLAGYWITPTSNDLWVVSFDAFRRTGRMTPVAASVGDPGRATGTVIDGTLYLHTTKGAPNGRVVAVSASKPAQANWKVLVAERPDAQIDAVAFGRGVMAVTYLKQASHVTEVFNLDGSPRGVLSQPGIGTTSLVASEDLTEAFLSFQSFNRPPTVLRVDLQSPSRPGHQWKTVSVPVAPDTVDVERVQYPAADGTPISMFLVRRKGLAPNRALPTLIVGYGALGVRMTPTFTPTLFHWFEAGGMLAVPHVRGGGEYGAAWHAAGARDRKQTSIDDVVAAAEWLMANGYTNAGKLAMYGGTGGGLLAGGAMTQRPDLFRAVILLDPLLDLLRYDRFPEARYWTSELGSASDAAAFGWLRSYSPYQRVAGGTRYPAVLLAGREAGGAVHAFHARKMAARLRAASTSSPSERPVLLWIDRADEDPVATELRALVDQRVFLMWQLGMK
jgi:prolyl oligopeptidase